MPCLVSLALDGRNISSSWVESASSEFNTGFFVNHSHHLCRRIIYERRLPNNMPIDWLLNGWTNSIRKEENFEKVSHWPAQARERWLMLILAADPGAVYHLISISHLRCVWNLHCCPKVTAKSSLGAFWAAQNMLNPIVSVRDPNKRISFPSKVWSYDWNVDERTQSRPKLLRFCVSASSSRRGT